MILQVIVNSLITGSIYATIAFGFTLMYGTMNFSIWGMAPMSCWVLTRFTFLSAMRNPPAAERSFGMYRYRGAHALS